MTPWWHRGLIKWCPNCESERPPAELLCNGLIDGRQCGWDLSSEPTQKEGWRPGTPPPAPEPTTPAGVTCPSGHPAQPGDLMCSVCGADIEGPSGVAEEAATFEGPPPEAGEVTAIAGWTLERRLETASAVRERFIARSAEGRYALLTLYAAGAEPDPAVYDVLRTLDRDHVPEVIETGRWRERAYEVSEDIQGGTLSDLGLLSDDAETLKAVVREIGGSIHAFNEAGLRHRDLRPGAVMVRAREPLDLVVTGFGSARLSDFDLDIVSPLETTRYTAPEAMAGGVAAASDWWSLGVLLLEQVTRGACFAGVNDQAFLIQVLANGPPIPQGLDPRTDLLLRGLLALDRRERWTWSEVQRWLAGETPPAPAAGGARQGGRARQSIALGGKRYDNAPALAVAAAQAANWDEARTLFLTGALVTWADETDLGADTLIELRRVARLEDVSEDLRLGLALILLNPALPLICRGEIVTPGWMLDHLDAGYALIEGPAPDLLARSGAEPWLARLKARAATVRERARQLEIVLDEDELRVHLLSTSRSRLAAVWAERRRVLPDTDHPGLVALLERRQTLDEDLILLLSANPGQFRTARAIIEEAAASAQRAGVPGFDPAAAAAWLEKPRRELYAAIEARLEGFARCGLAAVDQWADQFRLERRLPLDRALTLLAVAPETWSEPPKQAYVATLLDFFAKRITSAVMRGPLTRMLIGKTSARVDITQLGSERRPAAGLLDHLLLRNGQTVDVDPAAFTAVEELERRLRLLYSHATLYRRDTGIDGLYMGFPFLVMQEAKASARPRIAPVLLWPVRLEPQVGARGAVKLAFDRDREEVRLNPAFDPLLGPDATRKWAERAQELLGRASLSAGEVMDAFADLAAADGRALAPLPGKETVAKPGEDRLAPAAVLFHLAYVGQAVMEDLRHLRAIPPAGTALETLLRAGERPVAAEPLARPPELDRYFTAASDPSQEEVVLRARQKPGLLVEGPPGTGKSQTIVNIVADAIGQGRSLLVVCQKQAALDVVYKRLDAEGLAGRVIMVTDAARDRERTVRAVREQLERVAGGGLFGSGGGWRQQRQQTAARIEALEGELDRHNDALHAVDEACGLSYRLALADLIGLEAGARRPIDAPGLRPLLEPLNVATVAGLQEAVAPLARLWLPSGFEDSPLAALKPFSPDLGTVGAFARDLAAFTAMEASRAQVLSATPAALRVDDPAAQQDWLVAHVGAFRGLDDDARQRLARWSPLFTGAEAGPGTGPGIEIQAQLAHLIEALDPLPPPEPGPTPALAEGLSAPDLVALSTVAHERIAPASLWRRLSPLRWLRGRTLDIYFRAHGLAKADLAPFARALDTETALRPLRADADAVQARLGAELGVARKPAAALAADLRQLEGQLAAVRDLAERLVDHPSRAAAEAAIQSASLPAFEAFLDALRQGRDRHEARALSLAALEALAPWFAPAWLEARRAEIDADLADGRAMAAIAAAEPRLMPYQRFRTRAGQLDATALKVFRVLRGVASQLAALPEGELDAEVRRIMGRESRLAWKARLESAQPVLLLEAAELEAKAEALSLADEQMRSLNRRLLAEGTGTRPLRPLSEWEDITRLRGQRARRLREFLDRGVDLGLLALRPVWLMNPDIASRILPLRAGLFDTVIFDEASQIPVEYALPTLFRGQGAVVSGDEKQMPPTAFFSSRVENDEADVFTGDEVDPDATEQEVEAQAETWNRREIKDCPDLLQLAKEALPSRQLQIHYRSAYRELIEYSNPAFYAGRLSIPARQPAAEVKRVRPIEVIRADGVYEGQVNAGEAEEVVALLARLWSRPEKEIPSVGVVTFNRKQADLIEEVLERRAEKDIPFREALSRERERRDNGEDVGFFVKNVENVQGDERDVIVFSSTFGRNRQGTFRRFFGVLGQAGGERRLNVAVTRARRKVYLVTSMPVAEISDLLATRRPAQSPRDYLQAYFEYARAISAGELEAAQAIRARFEVERRERAFAHEVSEDGFLRAVADYLRSLGHRPQRVSGDEVFSLDFALEDPRTGLFGVGIECDAPQTPLLAHARAREMWRPQILRRSIPQVCRITSQGWYHDPEAEKARLRDIVAGAVGGGAEYERA